MEPDIISIVSVSTFIFWIFHIQRRVFYYLYFWQLKSYRLDRVIEEIKRNKGVLFSKTYIPVLILILFFYLSISVNLVFYLSVILYLILGYRSFILIFARKRKMPSFTKKMLSVSVLTFILLAILCFYFWQNIIIFILFFEILMPVFIFLSLGIIEIPASIFKRYLMFKARKKREKFKDLIVIGIAGSYGKSSTKEFLYTLLSEKYGKDRVLKTEGNVNAEIGAANTVLKKLNNNYKFFICEMGAYKRGEIRTACNIVKPKIGILTGINEQHLELFGSLENIIKGKFELIEGLPENGMAFFNAKNRYCRELYQKTLIKKFFYGENVQLAGMENIEGAKAVARELGMTEEEIFRAATKIENKFPGIKIREGISGLRIIDASYSANPDGVIANLEYLKTFPGRKVIVMPCLIELGKASKEVHRRIGRKIAEVCDLAIITTKDKFEEIKETAGEKAIFIEDPQEIFDKIKNNTQPGDVVLLESRVPNELISLLVIN